MGPLYRPALMGRALRATPYGVELWDHGDMWDHAPYYGSVTALTSPERFGIMVALAVGSVIGYRAWSRNTTKGGSHAGDKVTAEAARKLPNAHSGQ